MKNTIIILSAIIFICGLWVLIGSQSKFYRQLLKNEADFRDSILQKIASLQSERLELEKEIVNLQDEIRKQTTEIKSQIQKIKIVHVPQIDYSKFTDSALVQRLLSDYTNR
jgi:uncharacterized protein YaiL (DUF2058 family)